MLEFFYEESKLIYGDKRAMDKHKDGFPERYHLFKFPTPREIGRFLLSLTKQVRNEVPLCVSDHYRREDFEAQEQRMREYWASICPDFVDRTDDPLASATRPVTSWPNQETLFTANLSGFGYEEE